MSNNDALAALDRHLDALPKSEAYCIALSGGLDSVLLLQRMVARRESTPATSSFSLRAIHVHHGLSANADQWSQFCEHLCRAWSVDLDIVRVSIGGEGNVEARARDERYRCFRQHLKSGEILLLAHHQNDQAETVLYRLFRGAGGKGMGGMPQARPIGEHSLFRPWLHLPRSHLERAADELGVEHVHDETNDDEGFDRNYIRHTILRPAETRWKNASAKIAAYASKQQQSHQALTHYLDLDLQTLCQFIAGYGRILSLTGLMSRPSEVRTALVQRWLEGLPCDAMPEAILQRLWSELIPAAKDSQPELRWGGFVLRRFQQYLYAMPALDTTPAKYVIDPRQLGREYLVRLGYITVTIRPAAHGEGNLYLPENSALTVSPRHGGEQVRLLGESLRRNLKDVLKAGCIPPWEKRHWPLLYCNQRLVFIGEQWPLQIAQQAQSQGLQVSYSVNASRGQSS